MERKGLLDLELFLIVFDEVIDFIKDIKKMNIVHKEWDQKWTGQHHYREPYTKDKELTKFKKLSGEFTGDWSLCMHVFILTANLMVASSHRKNWQSRGRRTYQTIRRSYWLIYMLIIMSKHKKKFFLITDGNQNQLTVLSNTVLNYVTITFKCFKLLEQTRSMLLSCKQSQTHPSYCYI